MQEKQLGLGDSERLRSGDVANCDVIGSWSMVMSVSCLFDHV